MKSSRRVRYLFDNTSKAKVACCSRSQISSPELDSETIEIPIQSADDEQSPLKPLVNSGSGEDSAAVKIQSAYRSHAARQLVRKIAAVDAEANNWQRIVQRQETVDAVRANERERIKINEALMGLLFRLDSVPGLDPNVRELRRHVSRKIVGLQEILDAVSDSKVSRFKGFFMDWDDIVAEIEKEVCRERGGGDEMVRYCADHLGFQCLQRFLSEQ